MLADHSARATGFDLQALTLSTHPNSTLYTEPWWVVAERPAMRAVALGGTS